jgi:hypothetical protein
MRLPVPSCRQKPSLSRILFFLICIFGARQIGTLIIERFRLNPLRLTLVDYYPPDSLDGRRGEFNRVHLTWLDDRFDHPRWEPTDLQDVQDLVGQTVEDKSFWQPLQTRGWYRCQVGSRAALVHPVDVDEWQAIVNRDQTAVNIQRGFSSQVEVQTWALDQLTHLAAEHDTCLAATQSLRRVNCF